MIAIAPSHGSIYSFRLIAWVALLHAFAVLVIWTGEFYVGFSLVDGRTWLALAWLWLVWPVVLVMHPAASRRRVLVPLILGLAMLAPCAGSLFLFTAWMLEGLIP